ncbi:hypothetical protein NL676_035009 [Syzygium grande]|nr:hypothetical protein NL676_035009 [Syzygium grande]
MRVQRTRVCHPGRHLSSDEPGAPPRLEAIRGKIDRDGVGSGSGTFQIGDRGTQSSEGSSPPPPQIKGPSRHEARQQFVPPPPPRPRDDGTPGFRSQHRPAGCPKPCARARARDSAPPFPPPASRVGVSNQSAGTLLRVTLFVPRLASSIALALCDWVVGFFRSLGGLSALFLARDFSRGLSDLSCWTLIRRFGTETEHRHWDGSKFRVSDSCGRVAWLDLKWPNVPEPASLARFFCLLLKI